MKSTLKNLLLALLIPIVLVGLVCLYFADNIKGYYRFKEICAKDGGLKVYQPLERDVGWLADENEANYLLYAYRNISYVRFYDRNNVPHDLVRTNEKKDSSDDGFRVHVVDQKNEPIYVFNQVMENISDEIPLMRHASIVKNIRTGDVVVVYQEFIYRVFGLDWGVSQGVSCATSQSEKKEKYPNRDLENAIQQAFAKNQGG